MAANLILLITLFVAFASASGRVLYLASDKRLMYAHSHVMNLTDTQKLCRSLGGDLPVLRNFTHDVRMLADLTYEPIWLGVNRIAKPVQAPGKPLRRYTWRDGSAFSDNILESIPHANCGASGSKICCNLRTRPTNPPSPLEENLCNATNLPVCSISLTLGNMVKLLKAADTITNEIDKASMTTHVLPEFTAQLYDRVEGYRTTTHPVMYSLLAVTLSLVLLIVVFGIVSMRGSGSFHLKQKKKQAKQAAERQPDRPRDKPDGNGRPSREEEHIFLPEVGEIRNERPVMHSEI